MENVTWISELYLVLIKIIVVVVNILWAPFLNNALADYYFLYVLVLMLVFWSDRVTHS